MIYIKIPGTKNELSWIPSMLGLISHLISWLSQKIILPASFWAPGQSMSMSKAHPAQRVMNMVYRQYHFPIQGLSHLINAQESLRHTYLSLQRLFYPTPNKLSMLKGANTSFLSNSSTRNFVSACISSYSMPSLCEKTDQYLECSHQNFPSLASW